MVRLIPTGNRLPQPAIGRSAAGIATGLPAVGLPAVGLPAVRLPAVRLPAVGLLAVGLLAVGLLAVATGLAVAATQSGDGSEAPPDRIITEDVPELLRPRKARTEAEEDLLISGAHFAQARLHFQRNDEALALRHYQRAWRFNSDRVELLDQVVALASKLGRNEQAARYAVLSAERRPRDARLLIQLGGLLGQQNDTARALWMYEKAVELQGEEEITPQSIAIRVEMGRLYFLNEDFKNAARMFAEVRDALDDPQALDERERKALLAKPYALYSLIAASFWEDQRLDDAAAMYRLANSFDSSAPRLDYHLAEIALKRKEFQQARQLLNQYFDSKSATAGFEPYLMLLKICEHEHADPAAAKAALRKELRSRHEDDPKNVPLGYFWADELLEQDHLVEARELYADLLKRQPTADGYAALAKIYHRQENVAGLLGLMEQVVVRTESLDVLEDVVARIVEDQALTKQLLEHGRKQCLDAPVKVRQATGLAAAHLAIEAKQLDAFDAFAEIAAGAAGDKKVQVLEQLGLAVFVAEDPQRATRLFQQALAEKPDNMAASTLQFYLAGALQFAGDTEAALVAATQAGDLRSDSPRFASRMPWILYQARRHEQAEAEYQKLIERYEASYDVPGARDVLRETKLILSNIAVERQQFPQAEEWLAQVLDEFPEDIGALNDLGYLWADQGKHLQRSLAMTRKAVAAEPENIAYRDSLGWAYYRLGRFDDAIRELKIATAGEDPDGVILDHLGDAHLSQQQPDQAVAVWEKALAAFRKADQLDRLGTIEAKIKKHSQD